MFGVGLPELIIIMAVFLVLFGPDKLPELARNMGQLLGALRRNSDALRREFHDAVYTDDIQRGLQNGRRSLSDLTGDLREQLSKPAAEEAGKKHE